MSLIQAFYIYSDANPEIVETIETAIERINRVQVVEISSIQTLKTSNTMELRAVLNAVDNASLILCDLTTLSIDVLFVLGYSVTKNKSLWFSLNPSFPDSERNLKRVNLLSGLQYEGYENSIALMTKFLQKEPYTKQGTTLHDEIMQSMVMMKGKSLSMFYLKCEVQTDASVHLTRRLRETAIPVTVDDPLEVASQPLTWYAENIYHSHGVVAHFIDQNRQTRSALFQNEKYAFVLGLAFGLDKQILALAHQPFESKLSQIGIVFTHATAAECVRITSSWLPNIERLYYQQQEEYARRKSELETAAGLQLISLGEFVAEQEKTELEYYFVDTAAYKNALKASQYMIFVGRKGSGKTANLQQLAVDVARDKRNHVCLITPADYELEGVLELLHANLSKADTGYLLESLWKYLIYTELARSVYMSLKSRPMTVLVKPKERIFLDYIEKHKDLQEDFTVRMEYAVQELCKLDAAHNIRDQRVRVSEILHAQLLSELQAQLGEILADQYKVFVLVDNLDKAWRNGSDLELLSNFLFGLLSAGQTIASQLQKGGLNRKGINLILIVFLRSDIYNYIHSIAREKDKLSSERMDWTDTQLLRSVIEKRFAHAIGDSIKPDDVWNQYFSPNVKGVPTRDYIVSRIIPRPRDIIYFCREALNQAINHDHTRIEESDILQAERNYSDFAFKALLAETQTQLKECEALLYEFVGSHDVIMRSELEESIRIVGIADDRIEYTVELLCEATFLGLETRPNYFEFLYDSARTSVLKRQAQRLANQHGECRYRINSPFHAYLEIVSTDLLDTATPGNAHAHILKVLIPRMEIAFNQQDYAGVLHASATIFETMAKHIVNKPSVENQTLGSFFDSYKNSSSLPPEILDYIRNIYGMRNTVPLAGHGGTANPNITMETARTLMEITKAFVRIEYGNLGTR